MTANAFPQTGTKIQIVGNNRFMLIGCFDGLNYQLRRKSTIRNPNSSTNSKTALCKIQTITDCPTHAIIRHPLDPLGIDTTLKDKILNQMA